MGASHIKVSQQGLSNAASRIRQAKEEYDHAIQTIETTINSLDSVWTGQAQAAMKQKYLDKRSTFRQFSEEIDSYAKDIVAYRNAIAERDRTLAAKIQSNT